MTLKTHEMINEIKNEIKERCRLNSLSTKPSDSLGTVWTGGMDTAYRQCLDIINNVCIRYEQEELRWKNGNTK